MLGSFLSSQCRSCTSTGSEFNWQSGSCHAGSFLNAEVTTLPRMWSGAALAVVEPPLANLPGFTALCDLPAALPATSWGIKVPHARSKSPRGPGVASELGLFIPH